ncbi:MAG TPA: hypothetical protein VGG06_06165 [Thermoanaerobaculia bacterium]
MPQAVDALAVGDGAVKAVSKGVAEQANRVDEVAFAGAVWAHQHRQPAQLDIEAADALPILDGDAPDHGWTLRSAYAG